MDNEEVFKENLLNFEKTLSKFGYNKPNESSHDFILEEHAKYYSVAREYTNLFIKQKIWISCNFWEDNETTMSFYMSQADLEKSSFDILRFLKKRNLQNKLIFRSKDQFQEFIKRYFDDLKNLFENELNSQITGKIFENHWQEEMDEFNNRYR